MPRLENWSLRHLGDDHPDDTYKAPELRGFGLQGNVYGHPRHEDGRFVHTSRIMRVEGRQVQTRNTVYDLGQVDPEYVKWHKQEFPESPFDLESDRPLDEEAGRE